MALLAAHRAALAEDDKAYARAVYRAEALRRVNVSVHQRISSL